AGFTIAGEKSQFCIAGIRVVGYVCDADGRHPDWAKVEKILMWPDPRDTTEARAFVGICVYYRIWIPIFAIVAEPIFRLFKKRVPFEWGPEQREAADALKQALTSPPALISIDYSEEAGRIYLAIDSCLKGFGIVLSQIGQDGKEHPSRYD